MPNVEMPDGTVVAMPDNPTPEQLQRLASINHDGAKETVKEIGRVVDQGVRKGTTALPGLIADTVLSGARAATKPSSDRVMGSPPALMMRGLFSLFGNGADDTKFGDATNALQTAGGALPPVSQPQTSTGKAAGNILESTISTILGGGQGTVASKGILGAVSGATGEAAARYFGEDSPLARVLGAMVGGGITAGIQSRTPNASKIVKEATEHVTDEGWDNASKLEQVLNANKIPHSKAQLLGDKSTLDDVVATASSNPSVRPKLVTILPEATTAAPGGRSPVEQAVNVFNYQNLPPPGMGNRANTLSDVQEAASNKLRDIKEASNQAFTAAMPPKGIEYDQGRVKTLYNSLRQLADDPRFGKTTAEGRAILRLADDLVESRQWDTSRVNPTLMLRAEQAAKEAGVPLDPSQIPGAREVTNFVTNAHKINNLNKNLKLMTQNDDNYKGLPINDVRRILNQATPEFNRAREAKTAIMDSQYNPASKGLMGQIAQMGGGPNDSKLTAKDSIMALVFNPTQPQGTQIRQLAKDMGPEQVADLLREHINRTMQQTLRTDSKNPRSFVQALYESPAQRENIDAALEVAAHAQKMNPEAVKVGFRRLMEALDSFKDLKVTSGVSPTATAQQAGQNIVSQGAQLTGGIRRFFDQLTTKGTYNQIADLVTSADGLQKLRAIAREPDPTRMQQLIAATITASQEKTPK